LGQVTYTTETEKQINKSILFESQRQSVENIPIWPQYTLYGRQGSFQELWALHPPDCPSSSEAPYCAVTGTRPASPLGPACKTADPSYGNFSLHAQQTGTGSGDRHCGREAGKTSFLLMGVGTGTAPL